MFVVSIFLAATEPQFNFIIQLLNRVGSSLSHLLYFVCSSVCLSVYLSVKSNKLFTYEKKNNKKHKQFILNLCVSYCSWLKSSFECVWFHFKQNKIAMVAAAACYRIQHLWVFYFPNTFFIRIRRCSINFWCHFFYWIFFRQDSFAF